MKERTGDLWTIPADLRVVTTNGETKGDGAAIMGRGSALQAKERITGIEYHFGQLLSRWGNRVMLLTRPKRGAALACFPTKHRWREPSDPELIRKSATQLVALADKFGFERVVLPRPGTGAGRLSWEEVRPMLEEILDDRFTVATKGTKRARRHAQ